MNNNSLIEDNVHLNLVATLLLSGNHLFYSSAFISLYLYRGALLNHCSINHDVLEFTVEVLAQKSGVYPEFVKLRDQNVFDLQLSDKNLQVSSCLECESQFRDVYFSTHQVIGHHLNAYIDILSLFQTWRKGQCPAFNCNVSFN